jgi:predicted lipase
LTILVLVSIDSGCTKYIVRDQTVYQTELNQYDAWATKQASLLKGFVQAHCVCNDAKEFTTPECVQSADFILTIEARHEWHKAMSLHLAGLTKERPSQDPPAIPANSTLCPAGGE